MSEVEIVERDEMNSGGQLPINVDRGCSIRKCLENKMNVDEGCSILKVLENQGRLLSNLC